MRRSGSVLAKLVLTLAILTLIVAAFVCGSQMERGWTLFGDNEIAVGYVGVEPVARFNPLRPDAPNASWPNVENIAVEQRTQAAMLSSDTLMSAVLANPNLAIRQTKWFKSFKDPADAKLWLGEHFHAKPIAQSKLIKVYVDDTSVGGEARIIVEGIVSTHLDQQRNESNNKVLDMTSTLNNLKVRLEQHIRELNDRQNNLMMHLNIGQAGTPGRYTAVDLEYEETVKRFIQLLTASAEAQENFEILKEQISKEKDPVAIIEATDRDPAVVAASNRLVELQLSLVGQKETASSTTQQSAAGVGAFQAEVEKLRNQKLEILRASFLADAELRVKGTAAALDATQKRIEQLKGQLGDLAIAMSDYLSTSDELNSTRTNYKEIKDQLDTLAASNAGAAIDWRQHPEVPTER